MLSIAPVVVSRRLAIQRHSATAGSLRNVSAVFHRQEQCEPLVLHSSKELLSLAPEIRAMQVYTGCSACPRISNKVSQCELRSRGLVLPTSRFYSQKHIRFRKMGRRAPTSYLDAGSPTSGNSFPAFLNLARSVLQGSQISPYLPKSFFNSSRCSTYAKKVGTSCTRRNDKEGGC